MPPLNPWITIAVAAIALVGVLVNAILTFNVGRNATKVSRQLQNDDQKHEEQLAENSRRAAQALQDQKQEHERELARLEERLKYEFGEERMRQMLNDANWKRVHDKLVMFRQIGHHMIEGFKSLAAKGHEYDDEALFDAVSRAVRDHQEFKIAVGELHSEIKQDDYEKLYELQRYLIVVLLDVARTKSERLAKADVMQEHLERVKTRERDFQVWIEKFVKPDFGDDQPQVDS